MVALFSFDTESNQHVEIAAASAADIPKIIEIEQSVYSTPWSSRMFEEELSQDRSIFWSVWLDGLLVGYQIGWKVLDIYHLHNIALAKPARGKGISGYLLECLLVYVRRLGLTAIELEVRASNVAAIGLYRKAGFKAVGLRTGYYRKPSEDAVLMQLLV